MPKFVVTLEEIATYDVTVEAETEEEAAALAEETFVAAANFDNFPCTVHEREVANIEQMADETETATLA